jgi:DNA-directed RNA polymerase I subunit RPA2
LLFHVASFKLHAPAALVVMFYRSVHRGSYFAELRTTTVRKLLPESWGFLCPVHTPDGSPCGLLNHFTAACCIVTHGPQQPQQMEDNLVQVSLVLLSSLAGWVAALFVCV